MKISFLMCAAIVSLAPVCSAPPAPNKSSVLSTQKAVPGAATVADVARFQNTISALDWALFAWSTAWDRVAENRKASEKVDVTPDKTMLATLQKSNEALRVAASRNAGTTPLALRRAENALDEARADLLRASSLTRSWVRQPNGFLESRIERLIRRGGTRLDEASIIASRVRAKK